MSRTCRRQRLRPFTTGQTKCAEILRKCADAVEVGVWVIEKVVEDDLASTSLEVA